MSEIEFVRDIQCPYCGANQKVDLEDYVIDTVDEDRQMGPEIIHEFSVDDYECSECGGIIKITGYISEYPVGTFNSEDINIQKED